MKRPLGAPHASRSRGAALVWSLFVSIIIISSTFVITTLGASAKRLSDSNRRQIEASFLAEAAVAHAKDRVYAALRQNVAPPAAGTITVDGVSVDYTVTETGVGQQTTDAAGLTRTERVFRLQGDAVVEGTTVVSREIVRSVQVPLFQFALFYEQDMFFFYPAPMEVAGPVHCNSNVYFYAHQDLKFDTNHFAVAGDVYGRPKWDQWLVDYPWGDPKAVDIRRWVPDPYNTLETEEYVKLQSKTELDALGIMTTGGFDSDFAGYDANGDGDFDDFGELLPFAPGTRDNWSEPSMMVGSGTGQTLRTKEHGTAAVDLPAIGDFEMFVDAGSGGGDHVYDAGLDEFVPVAAGTGTHVQGTYFQEADLSIVSSPDGTWKAYDSSGIDVSSDVASAVTSSTLYDARQAEGGATSLQSVEIDIALLAGTGRFPANGILYLAGEGAATGTDVKAFVLKNGSTLPADLNVVSPDSLYVQGDYNTNAIKSAAVMADAVNLLSNSWDGSKAQGSLPTATETTYNMSILSGDVEALEGAFNGGPHNLPRFHESWSGVIARILGSIVCLGHSRKATGSFHVGGDYYQAPNRIWSFDTRLRDMANLPPGTPTYIDIEELVVL